MEKKNKIHLEVAYVVGIYDNQYNRCYYMKNLNFSTVFKHLSRASVMDAETANRIVESNIYRGRILISEEHRKKRQLFVSKVFCNTKHGIIKLTKQNSFQLMEIVANNI